MKLGNISAIALFAATVSIAGAKAAGSEEVVVFAAASLKTALDEVATNWQKETGHTVTLSYAGSGTLANQIIAGAPADIFISANTRWVDVVEKAGLIANNQRRNLLGNTLVLIAHGKDASPVEIKSHLDLKRHLGGGKLAMALVDSVPAGIYGKAALTSLNIWETVSPSVAQTDNVRAALVLVASGEAPFGIVYASDTAASDNVTVVGTFPADSHPPIVYPAALLTEAADAADKEFYEALASDAAKAAFRKQGFEILN